VVLTDLQTFYQNAFQNSLNDIIFNYVHLDLRKLSLSGMIFILAANAACNELHQEWIEQSILQA
jgi:hypothetical protein